MKKSVYFVGFSYILFSWSQNYLKSIVSDGPQKAVAGSSTDNGQVHFKTSKSSLFTVFLSAPSSTKLLSYTFLVEVWNSHLIYFLHATYTRHSIQYFHPF